MPTLERVRTGQVVVGSFGMSREGASGKEVHVHVGNRLKLILSSDYWTVPGGSAPAVVRRTAR
jgi:hypothetical protein